MTIPSERYYALIKTREFLEALLDPKRTPKVPRSIRKEAYWCLRHFPWDVHLSRIAKKLPDILDDGQQHSEGTEDDGETS
jgi:hypothetical protein